VKAPVSANANGFTPSSCSAVQQSRHSAAARCRHGPCSTGRVRDADVAPPPPPRDRPSAGSGRRRLRHQPRGRATRRSVRPAPAPVTAGSRVSHQVEQEPPTRGRRLADEARDGSHRRVRPRAVRLCANTRRTTRAGGADQHEAKTTSNGRHVYSHDSGDTYTARST